MSWFVSKYTKSLEAQVTELKMTLAERNRYIETLIERLLRKEAIPPTVEQQRQNDMSDMDTFMKRMDIFEDVDQPHEETNEIGEFVKE